MRRVAPRPRWHPSRTGPRRPGWAPGASTRDARSGSGSAACATRSRRRSGPQQLVGEPPDALDDTPCCDHEQVQLPVVGQGREPGADDAGHQVTDVGDHGDGCLELDDSSVHGDAVGHGLDPGSEPDRLEQVRIPPEPVLVASLGGGHETGIEADAATDRADRPPGWIPGRQVGRVQGHVTQVDRCWARGGQRGDGVADARGDAHHAARGCCPCRRAGCQGARRTRPGRRRCPVGCRRRPAQRPRLHPARWPPGRDHRPPRRSRV